MSGLHPDTTSVDTSDLTVAAVLDDVNEGRAVQHVVQGMNLRLSICEDAAEALNQIKSLLPAVVFVDSQMPGLDVVGMLRILSRHPDTAATAVVLIAPPDVDDRQLRHLQAMQPYAILNRPLTCRDVRENLRAALRYAEEAARLYRPTPGNRQAPALVRGCNSLLRRAVWCPFHDSPVEVASYSLRSGKVYAASDRFDIPVYSQAAKGADFVDYHRVCVGICPQCYAASSNEGFFLATPASSSAVPPAADLSVPSLRSLITIGAAEREKLALKRLGTSSPTLFSHERGFREALLSFELAIATSKALYQSAPKRRADELVRIAEYELQQAVLLESVAARPLAHDPPLARDTAAGRALRHRLAALPWLTRAFEECQGLAMYRAGYQLVVLHAWLGDDAQAAGCLKGLKELTTQSRRELVEPALLERFLRRAQAGWADRERFRSTARPAAA